MTMRKRSAAAAAVAVLILSITPAFAALAPHYQRLRELRALIDNNRIISAFGGRSIDRIEYISLDLYRLTGGGCHLDAKIVDQPLPDGMVGARRFTIEIGPLNCP